MERLREKVKDVLLGLLSLGIGLLVLLGIAALGSLFPSCSSSNSNSAKPLDPRLSSDYYELDFPSESGVSANLSPDFFPEQPLPTTGSELEGSSYGRTCYQVIAPSNQNCYAKVIDSSGETRVGFFVRAGETGRAYVPAGTYTIRFAMGITWYGVPFLFGSKTSYGQDAEPMALKSGKVMTYTLTSSAGGPDFSMDPLDRDDF